MSDYTETIELCKIAQHMGGPQNLSAVGIGRYLRLCSPDVILALIAENQALRECANFRAVQSLRADCEALRKEAERYRWLRDSSESVHQFYLSTPIWFTGVKFSKENVDLTIDAAMSAQVTP